METEGGFVIGPGSGLSCIDGAEPNSCGLERVSDLSCPLLPWTLCHSPVSHPWLYYALLSCQSPSWRIHGVFTFLLPLLMGLLQVDYQNKKVSPLDTHPINIWLFFAATCLYCLGLSLKTELQIRQSNYSQFINHVILSSGALSAVFLASIFLPRLLGWFCLGIWTVLPVMLSRHFIKQIYENLKKRIMEKLTNIFNQFRGDHIEESEPAGTNKHSTCTLPSQEFGIP